MTVQRMGQPPRLTYLYGHSAGARIAHEMNYTPGLNVGRDGKRLFDGLLADDMAGGVWLPFLFKDGKDVLFATEAEKAAFIPQLDITHQMYNNINDRVATNLPIPVSHSFLENKRTNSKILRDKGLAPSKERMYEVRGISHMGAETSFGPNQDQNLDLSRAMDRFIDMLDARVGQRRFAALNALPCAGLAGAGGNANTDGTIKYPALAYPEIACPLGVYYPSPVSTAITTAFAPFSGTGIEPLDRNKQFIDMNHDGVWDFVETPTAAWQRLGLLQKNESLQLEKYISKVVQAARQATKFQQGGVSSRIRLRG